MIIESNFGADVTDWINAQVTTGSGLRGKTAKNYFFRQSGTTCAMGSVSILLLPPPRFSDTASNGLIILGWTLEQVLNKRRVHYDTFICFYSDLDHWQSQHLCSDKVHQHVAGWQHNQHRTRRRYLLLCLVRGTKGCLFFLLPDVFGSQCGANINRSLRHFPCERLLPDVQQGNKLLGIHSGRSRVLSQPESKCAIGKIVKE